MDFDFEVTEDIQTFIDNCVDSIKAEEMVQWLANICRKRALAFTDYQWKSVINHICAMISRRESNEELEIDPELFVEVTADSLQLAETIVNMIGGISNQEKYLLSIHFEGVKENNLG